MAIGVTSATKTAHASIFSRMVATMSGDPATPLVSDVSSTLSSRSACNSSIASASASLITFRVTHGSRSLCQDQKTVLTRGHYAEDRQPAPPLPYEASREVDAVERTPRPFPLPV